MGDELYTKKLKLESDIEHLLDEFYADTGNKVFDIHVYGVNMYVPLMIGEPGEYKLVPNDKHGCQVSIKPYEFDYSIRKYGRLDDIDGEIPNVEN